MARETKKERTGWISKPDSWVSPEVLLGLPPRPMIMEYIPKTFKLSEVFTASNLVDQGEPYGGARYLSIPSTIDVLNKVVRNGLNTGTKAFGAIKIHVGEESQFLFFGEIFNIEVCELMCSGFEHLF